MPRDPGARTAVLAPSHPNDIGVRGAPAHRAVTWLVEVDGVQVRVLLDAKIIGAGCVLVSAVNSAKRWTVDARSVAGLRLDVQDRAAG
jgi:hypothetical protein